MSSPSNEGDGRLTASSSRRAPTMGSSVVFTPQSQERPLLDRLESVQVGPKGPKLPAPLPRAEEEGVTATTSSLHHSRRPSRKATGGSTSGSFDFGQPSRSSTARTRTLNNLDEEAVSSPAPTQGKSRFPRQLLKPTRLIDLHELRPDIKGLSILPTVHFPGQGSGRESEFLQEEPIWARKPWKWLYMVYFGLSVGLIFLPYFAIASIVPKWRARPTWTWKRSTLVRLYRHGTRLTFRTHTNLSRDLSKAVPHSSTLRCKFVWIAPPPEEEVRGELKRAATQQQIAPARTCGFWYGEPLKSECTTVDPTSDGQQEPVPNSTSPPQAPFTTGVGRRAGVNEKVVYHLHGGAYWIGTAHEKDVTAAVNTEVLRYLDELYRSGKSRSTPDNRCTRSLSLDYRLSVPHRPRLGSYPAALLDALAGYLYLVRHCGFQPRNIIVAGDSAGGNLALALCRYLRDEKVEDVPGACLLLSPWADVSRSHAGPLSAPNKFSSAYVNREVDIISNSVAFRNTAVQAFLGDLPAREAYRNPYLSSCSLQLDPTKGGDGPDWGYRGFPRQTYIVSGSAEISYDQHLTLAHRMAAGTRRRTPYYTGDKLSRNSDPYELAARLSYPRPHDHEISLWPSAEHLEVPQGEGLATMAGAARVGSSSPSAPQPNGVDAKGEAAPAPALASGDGRKDKKEEQAPSPTAAEGHQNEQPPGPPVQVQDYDDRPADQEAPQIYEKKPPPQAEPQSQSQSQSQSQPATKLQLPPSAATLAPAMRPHLVPLSSGGAFMRMQSRSALPTPGSAALRFAGGSGSGSDGSGSNSGGSHHGDDEGDDYFGAAAGEGPEQRDVYLDEVRDGVHDLLLFGWHEPERGLCWRRIARWIDGQTGGGGEGEQPAGAGTATAT